MAYCVKLLAACIVGELFLLSTAISQQQSSLVVAPATGVAVSGQPGGPFSPSTFEYRVSASAGIVSFSITTPAWLKASPSTGETDTGGVIVRLEVSPEASLLGPGAYGPAVAFTNVTNGRGSTTKSAVLTIRAASFPATVNAAPPLATTPTTPSATAKTANSAKIKAAPLAKTPPVKTEGLLDGRTHHLLDSSGDQLINDRGERLLAK